MFEPRRNDFPAMTGREERSVHAELLSSRVGSHLSRSSARRGETERAWKGDRKVRGRSVGVRRGRSRGCPIARRMRAFGRRSPPRNPLPQSHEFLRRPRAGREAWRPTCGGRGGLFLTSRKTRRARGFRVRTLSSSCKTRSEKPSAGSPWNPATGMIPSARQQRSPGRNSFASVSRILINGGTRRRSSNPPPPLIRAYSMKARIVQRFFPNARQSARVSGQVASPE